MIRDDILEIPAMFWCPSSQRLYFLDDDKIILIKLQDT
jgi:hypothetical protein